MTTEDMKAPLEEDREKLRDRLADEYDMSGGGSPCDWKNGWDDCITHLVKPLEAKLADAERQVTELKDTSYCPICGSCGEIGCCGAKRCKYPTVNAEDIEASNKLIDEKESQLTASQERVEKLTAFIAKVKNSSTCAATVLVAGQVLEGHDVRQTQLTEARALLKEAAKALAEYATYWQPMDHPANEAAEVLAKIEARGNL